MNKTFLLGLLILHVFGCQQNRGQRPTKEPETFGQKWGEGYAGGKYNGKGNVKAVVEYNIKDYSIKNGVVTLNKDSKEIVSTDEFTEDGYLISTKFWFPLINRFPDQHMFHEVYLLDNGKPFKLIRVDKSEDSEYPQRTETTVTYDTKGNIIQEIWEDVKFSSDYGVKNRDYKYFRYTTITEYDIYNCPVLTKRYDKDNNLDYEIKYYYNDKNKVVLEEEFQKSKLVRKQELKTGQFGEWHLTTSFKDSETKIDDGNEIASVTKDTNGNILEKRFKDGWSKKYLFKDNKEIGYENYRNGNFYSSIINTFREDGVLLEYIEVTTDPSYEKKIVKYSVDEVGNWTEEIAINDSNQILSAKYRVIYYYEQ